MCAITRWHALFTAVFLYATYLQCGSARAETGSAEMPATSLEHELDALLGAVEQARFEEANAHARTLLATSKLSARQRNEALELLAVTQIAARDEALALATLDELFSRDPQHPEWLRDPGPSVSATFARARGARRTTLVPVLTGALARDGFGRTLLTVQLGAGRDAVDSVHVFVRTPRDAERTHLVADVGTRSLLTFVLPAYPAPTPASAAGGELELVIEARAPSSVLLAQAGSQAAPLRLSYDSAPVACPAMSSAPPLRRAWWLWTSIAIIVAGIGISGAIVAN